MVTCQTLGNPFKNRHQVAGLLMVFFSADEVRRLIPKLFFSLCVSAGLLGVLFRSVLVSTETATWESLVSALVNFSCGYLLIYIVASLVRTLFQALRYRHLLVASGNNIPSLSLYW